FGPLANRKRIPLGPTDRAEKNGVGLPTHTQGCVAEWSAGLVDGGAPDGHLHKRELVLKLPRAFLQDVGGGTRDFRTDAVTGKKDNRLFQLHGLGTPRKIYAGITQPKRFRSPRPRLCGESPR